MSPKAPANRPAREPLVRLAVRFPVLTRILIRALVAVPASRLRTRLWAWGMRIGFTTSDRSDWEFLRTYMHPDAQVDFTRGGGWRLDLDPEYRGPDGYTRWFEAFTEIWSGFNTGELEVVAPPGNRVFVVSHPQAKGVASGIEVGGELSAVFTYDRGWLRRIQGFADRDEALATIGLERRGGA